MMTLTRKYSNIRILSWPNIRIYFFQRIQALDVSVLSITCDARTSLTTPLVRKKTLKRQLDYKKTREGALLPLDAMLARYTLSSCVCPPVCPFVHHKPVLYQNG